MLKRARAKLLENLKLCWPEIFPVDRSVEALGYSTLIPAFCTYARKKSAIHANFPEGV
jgi:hypothetical protein